MGPAHLAQGRSTSPAAAAIRLSLLRALAVSVVMLAMAALAMAASPPPARPQLISFPSDGSGQSTAASQAVPEPAAPTAVVTGRDSTVSWPATSLSGGTPAEHYVVRRYTAGGSLQTVLPSCSGDITATSCVEQVMPTGTWRYSVQAAIGGWLGPESALGSAVTVGDASLTLSPTTVTSLPATLNGTITNFANGEGLSFHLDSATGTALSGTPTVVPASGTAPVTVTLPVGTPDSPHSIFAVGSTGTAASAAITINDTPALASLVMRDVNINGKVDQVLATFDDTLAPYSAGIAPWTLTNTPSGGSLTDVSVTGNVATLTIAEGPSAATTAVGTFTVALVANSAGIRDSDEHLASFAATAPVDQAPPAVVSAVMQDTGTANGRIDRVVFTFSEAMATYSAGTAPWSLANAPSGGTLASVATTSTTATLTITEGAGAPDTSVGSFTVTMAPGATGVRDAAGNLASFSGAPTDGAKPVYVLGEMFDGDADGRVDQVVVTFSEVLASYSAGTGVWTLTSAPSGATLNNVNVAGTQATLALNEGTGAATTAVGSFRTALTGNATGVRDEAGNLSSHSATAPTDKAAPVLVTLNMLDNNSNGKVDRVTAVFSETLSAYTAGTTPWTLTNVPSGGTIASVTAASASATLTITEGAGAADTSVGAMTVALATNAAGVRDAALNLASFSARAPLDGARPRAVTVVDTNGGTDGLMQAGDTLSITFSEALSPATVPSTTSVTLTDPSGTGNDTLSIANILNGARTTGSNLNISLDTSSATFAESTVALTNSNRTITITVAGACSGTACGSIGTATAATNLSFLAATTLTDPAGNLPVTTAQNFSLRLF